MRPFGGERPRRRVRRQNPQATDAVETPHGASHGPSCVRVDSRSRERVSDWRSSVEKGFLRTVRDRIWLCGRARNHGALRRSGREDGARGRILRPVRGARRLDTLACRAQTSTEQRPKAGREPSARQPLPSLAEARPPATTPCSHWHLFSADWLPPDPINQA